MNSAVAAYKLMVASLEEKPEDGYKVMNGMSQRAVYDAALSLAWAASRPVLAQCNGDVAKALAVLTEWQTVAALDPDLAAGQTDA